MYKLKTAEITAIHPAQWKTFSFVKVDDCTYTDSTWAGCDYRVADDASLSDGLAIDIYITGRSSKWNGVTYETAARIVFPNDGHDADEYTKGIVYSTAPLSNQGE